MAKASSEDLDNAILIQEKIEGPEYGMDVLSDFEGEYMGTFVRRKLAMRAGETDKAISVLEEIRGSRCIGLISHVAELQSRIPTRLEVRKTATGSTAEVV